MRPVPLPQLLLGLCAVAVGIAVAGVLASDAVREAKRAKDEITVTGSARTPISADLAQWTVAVAAQASTPGAASRALAGFSQRVRSFLTAGGVAGNELQTPPFSTEAVEERREDGSTTGKILAWKLTQRFTVTSRDIDRIEALAARLSTLLDQGVAASADPIQYVSTQLGKARLQALEAATRNARERAETIVRNLGGRLGKVRSAQLGVYQVVQRNSTDVSDYGINDTSTREKDVISVVSLTFAVK